MLARFQLYTGQSISANTYWSPADFVNDKMPLKDLISTYKYAYDQNLKTLYYTTFNDQSLLQNEVEDGCEGGGCSVSIKEFKFRTILSLF